MGEVHAIQLTFLVDEPVTPDHLARRVGEACSKYGALRPGESIILPSDPSRKLIVTEESISVKGLFGR